MKLSNILVLFLIISIAFSGCTSYKKMMYLRDAETITAEEFASRAVAPFEARIMQSDVLNISVYTSDPEAAIPYNLSASGISASNYSPISPPPLQKYLVDINGQINYPTLGLIKVSGMTLRELEYFIQEKISKFVKEKPIVVVQFLDKSFTVIGEVGGPGTFSIKNEKLNMLQAFSLAGGTTNYTRLDNIKIFREDSNGKKEIIIINLNDKNLLFSPNYYVQHNDIIYVDAKKSKHIKVFNQEISVYTYSLTFLLSISSLILNYSRN